MKKTLKTPKQVRTDQKLSAKTDSYAKNLSAVKSQSTLQLLFKTARLTNEWALTRSSVPGLRASHMNLLPHIDLTGTRVTTLAERVGVSKQAVSELVDEMVSLGHLTRAPDPSDGRAKLVLFTAAGRQGIVDGLALLQKLEGELGSTIGLKSMQNLHKSLTSVLRVVEGSLASAQGSESLMQL